MRLRWRAKRHGCRNEASALGQRSTVQIGQIGHRVNALVASDLRLIVCLIQFCRTKSWIVHPIRTVICSSFKSPTNIVKIRIGKTPPGSGNSANGETAPSSSSSYLDRFHSSRFQPRDQNRTTVPFPPSLPAGLADV